MPIKDKEVNKNVINIKIGDIDKKKKSKNKKKKMLQRAKQIGPFNYASSAPSAHRPLHPQVPTQSNHYNRAQEANLSTLVGAETELKLTKEREKTLNSLIDSTVNDLKKSKDRERQLKSYISNTTSLANTVRKTPKNQPIPSPNLSPIFSSPFSASKDLFSSQKEDKPLNDMATMMENNKKADVLLQKEPLPDNDNSLFISSDSENSSSKKNQPEQQIAHKKVTIVEEAKKEEPKAKKSPKLSITELRKEIAGKGFPVSYEDETSGKQQMYRRNELLERYNFLELDKYEKREQEKKPKRRGLIVEDDDDDDDTSYIKNIFPVESVTNSDYILPMTEDSQLNNLFSNLNLS